MKLRPGLLALLVLAVLGLLAVLALPRLATPREGSTEVRFVREMIQHHAQAVDMATRIRDRSDDPTLRSLALDIMLSQQEQIGQMRGWLTLWGLPWGGQGMTAEHARMMGMATPAELNSLDTPPVPQAEKTFLQLMIRHHQGALEMLKPALGGGVRPEVQALARQIHAAQGGEIKLMTQLLADRDAQPLPAPAGDGGGMDGMEMGGHQH
ncbi:DUF305 domain-containing protein [Deinococcus aetherius]|uniref:DUF305 domain-containing protein n=1 Tax=Deinococcus aetherius TaxID=200252 RepID=A0ABM8ABP9_9DEIO|nr:DUF305 domain-containing protein [Deinococcus aetherius]BDP41199.1 DUF305 domain-containing protein [Deinococcus aetherius]